MRRPPSRPDALQPQDLTPPPRARAAAMWRRYLRFWGPRAAADVDDELQFHVDMRVHDYLARGMTEAEARAAVERRLGNLAAVRAKCLTIDTRRERRMRRAQWIDAFAQDVRVGARAMLRQKGWTAVAVITLALGIGANTAMFSVVHDLVLHPLNYPHADRLVVVYQQPKINSVNGVSVYVLPTTRVLRAWRAGSHSFEDLEGFATSDRILRTTAGGAVTVHTAQVQPGFARFTGDRPLLGRYFTPADVESRARVALLSAGVWRSRYGAADSVLGRSITLGRDVYTIVGVMPPTFQLPSLLQDHTDVFLPLDVNDNGIGVSMIGRLRPGVTPARAARELDTLSAHMPGAGKALGFVAKVVPPGRIIRFRDSLLLLSGAVALVLIIACANVAHLLLARGAARRREMAIRMAIGAGRGRVFRQLITEALILAAAGCTAGLGVGWAALRALVALRPNSLSQLATVHMDVSTLGVAAGLAALTGVAFGLVGALQSVRLAAPEVLRVGAPTASGSGPARLRSLLVVTEMALCTTLLVGAALLIRSFAHLQSTDPGFRPSGLYAVSPDLSATSDTTTALRWAFYDRLAGQVRALPGVAGATVATTSPPGRNFRIGALQIEGAAPPDHGATSFVNMLGVRPGFFQLVGMHFVAGGIFTDTTTAGRQVIINEGMARKYWPGRSAVGHRVRVEQQGQGDWLTIVGVVDDAATGGMLMQRTDPILYTPPPPFFSPTMIVRARNPAVALPAIRDAVRTMNAAIPPVEIRSVVDAMEGSLGGHRYTMLLLAAFTGLALVLAAIGLYGVMAYSVAQRTREIGVRIALGATTGHVARSVVGRGALLAATGMAIGLVGAHWGTRLLANMLSGVTPGDPASFAVAGGVLLATAILACLTPMWRAARVDPIIAMRAE